MAEADINTKFTGYVCNNWECLLHKHPGLYLPKLEPVVLDKPVKVRDRTISHAIQRWNYGLLRGAKVSSYDASRMSSTRQTRAELERLGIPYTPYKKVPKN